MVISGDLHEDKEKYILFNVPKYDGTASGFWRLGKNFCG